MHKNLKHQFYICALCNKKNKIDTARLVIVQLYIYMRITVVYVCKYYINIIIFYHYFLKKSRLLFVVCCLFDEGMITIYMR
jgi:hypothetical protein